MRIGNLRLKEEWKGSIKDVPVGEKHGDVHGADGEDDVEPGVL